MTPPPDRSPAATDSRSESLRSGGGVTLPKRQLFRILDANFNRSREGLRVCEEVSRFILRDRKLTERFKKTRHAVSDALKTLPLSDLLASRDIRGDVAKEPSRLEARRSDVSDLFAANIERVKESVRVLEEMSKHLDPKLFAQFKRIRFEVYGLEKKAMRELETLRDHGPKDHAGKKP